MPRTSSRHRGGTAAHDVQAVGLLGVFVVAFGDPLIQVGGVGVAAAGHRDVQQGTAGGFAEHGVGGVGGDALAECTVTA